MGLYVPRYSVIGDVTSDENAEIRNNLTINDKGMLILRTVANVVILSPSLNVFTILSNESAHNSYVMHMRYDEHSNAKLSDYVLISLTKIRYVSGTSHIGVLVRLPTLDNMRITDVYKSMLSKYMCLMYTPMYLHMSMCMDVINKIFSVVVIPCIHDYYFEQLRKPNSGHVCDYNGKSANILRNNLDKLFLNFKFK